MECLEKEDPDKPAPSPANPQNDKNKDENLLMIWNLIAWKVKELWLIEYKSFILAFDSRIKSKIINSENLLYYVHQRLSYGPKDLKEGSLQLQPYKCYRQKGNKITRQGVWGLL